MHSEPFLDLYKQSLISSDQAASVTNKVRTICDDLVEQSQNEKVFVKDMAYHAQPFITDDFIKHANHTFLTRDPRLTIPSLYKMRPDFAAPVTGFEGQWRLFQRVWDIKGRAPLVLDGEQLKISPQKCVKTYFESIGLEMPRNILCWPRGSIPDWTNREEWHVDAIASNGFIVKPSAIRLDGLPDRVIELISSNLNFYQKLKEFSE